MASSLSNLVDNLAEGIHKVKCKMNMKIKNMKRLKLNTKIVSVTSNTQTVKMISYHTNVSVATGVTKNDLIKT